MAPIVINFFPKESVVNQFLKIGGRRLFSDLFIEYVLYKYFVFMFEKMVRFK